MNWILNYIDIPVGDSLDKAEDRCFRGWEPFAITEWDYYYKPEDETIISIAPPRPMYRFWFKKRVKQ